MGGIGGTKVKGGTVTLPSAMLECGNVGVLDLSGHLG
jgi:hypothetical protein